ncbi:MAG TPA: TetR/AcrR family transcriptional regulator [Solirubrobacteraceae bacterium]|nr:TetR/AcrR family transcriptional regulator [Solirubrobacteraceae bacterium]
MVTRPTRTPRLTPEARRAQLLDAALDVLTEQGFGAVTVEAVVQRAGVTRPVVYDLFGDLQQMMVALIDTAERTTLEPLLEIVDVHPGDDVDPDRFLHDCVLAFLRAVKSDPRTWRLVLMPPRGSSVELQQRIRRSRLLVADRVTALLDWGIPRRGGPPGLDHSLAARLIVAAGEDAARLMLAHPRRFTPELLARQARDFLRLIPHEPRPHGLPKPELTIPIPRPASPPAAVPGARKRMPQSQRREQLLDVTLALLAEEGFGALSMEAIARRADVNRAVVYRSFANLHVLLAALLHREDKRMGAMLDELLPAVPTGTAGELLSLLLARYLGAVVAAPLTWHLALLRPESAPLTLQKLVNRRRAALAGRLAPLVRWGVAAGGTPRPEVDLEALGRMLLTVGEELGRLALDDPEFPPERLLTGCWTLLNVLDPAPGV